MKKTLIFIICVAMIFSIFAACSKEKEKATTTALPQETTSQITTDDAKIKEVDAINLVESYSNEELGLTDKQRKSASFMVASDGVKIEKDYYIEVIATIKTEHKDGDNTTYTFDNLGVYYISYDGKKIMRKDMEAKEPSYIEMKIKAVPSTTKADSHTTQESKENKNE